jgi:hypothetical protein
MRKNWLQRGGPPPFPTCPWGSALSAGLLAVLLLGTGARSSAQEAIAIEVPTPASVHEEVTPLERSFVEPPARVGLFPGLREWLQAAPPFIRDTTLEVHLRTYYRYNQNFDATINEAWALGGALAYQSGWLLDRLALGTVLYTSQPLYAPKDRDGTELLQPGQEGYTVLGQLYGRVKLFDAHFLNLYRYAYNTPYLNKDDSRMTPNTFEGYTFQGALGGKERAWGLKYGGGYITKIKERNAEDFVWLSQAAGAQVERGVVYVGARFSAGRFSLGAINYYADDIINIVYTEVRYTWPVTERLGVRLTAQFTDQRSVGADLLTGSAFDTHQVGVMTDISYAGAILSLAYTHNAAGSDLLHPWSSYPGYTSAEVSFFNQAGESAFNAKLSYDFTGLGLTGVTAYVLFVHGWGRVDPSTGAPVPNDNEYDVDVQWRPGWRFLKGVWLRTRYGIVHQYEAPRQYQHDFRIIVNYDFSLL